MKQTLGEYRVGTDFNPSGDTIVTEIKALAAVLINAIDEIEIPMSISGDQASQRRHLEVTRLRELAMTSIEEGAMWAVKAATKK